MFCRCLWYRFLIDFGVPLRSLFLSVWATLTDPNRPWGPKNRAPPLAHVLSGGVVGLVFFVFGTPPPQGPTWSDVLKLGDVIMVNGGHGAKPSSF